MKAIGKVTLNNRKYTNMLNILEILKASNLLTMIEIKDIYSKSYNSSKYKTSLSFCQSLHHAKNSCLKKGFMRRIGKDRFKSRYEITLKGLQFLQKERG